MLPAPPAPIEAPAPGPDDRFEIEEVPSAGEVLDAAIAQCELGNREAALSLFAAIRSQLAPPPALRLLIERYEASQCAVASTRTSALSVQLGTGYDSNATQGITARSLLVGSGPDAVELALDDRYRPRASSFAQGTVDYRTAVGAASTVQLSFGHRANVQTPDYDLTTLAAAGQTLFTALGQRTSAQLEWAESWLGGAHYQRAVTGGLRWLKPLPDGAWLAGLTGSRLYYLTQPSQDAMQTELSLLREWKIGPAAALTGGGSLIYDRALGARPGGDRQGAQAQVGAQFGYNGWTLRPFASYTQWQSRDVFAEGLIDQRRRNRLGQLALELERPVSATSRVVLQWRDRDSRDNIALYRYRSQTLSVYWRWDPR
jgi:hypothetical protein